MLLLCFHAAFLCFVVCQFLSFVVYSMMAKVLCWYMRFCMRSGTFAPWRMLKDEQRTPVTALESRAAECCCRHMLIRVFFFFLNYCACFVGVFACV